MGLLGLSWDSPAARRSYTGEAFKKEENLKASLHYAARRAVFGDVAATFRRSPIISMGNHCLCAECRHSVCCCLYTALCYFNFVCRCKLWWSLLIFSCFEYSINAIIIAALDRLRCGIVPYHPSSIQVKVLASKLNVLYWASASYLSHSYMKCSSEVTHHGRVPSVLHATQESPSQ